MSEVFICERCGCMDYSTAIRCPQYGTRSYTFDGYEYNYEDDWDGDSGDTEEEEDIYCESCGRSAMKNIDNLDEDSIEYLYNLSMEKRLEALPLLEEGLSTDEVEERLSGKVSKGVAVKRKKGTPILNIKQTSSM